MPFRMYAVNADTGQPLGSNVGRKTSVKYYEVKKDKNGKKSVIAHKSPIGSAAEDGNGKFGEVCEPGLGTVHVKWLLTDYHILQAKKGDHGKNDGKKESGDGGVDKVRSRLSLKSKSGDKD